MKKYTKETKIHPCRLEKSDLLAIENLVRSDVDTRRVEDFKVSSNNGNVSISETSINDFLNHTGLPKILSGLSISIIGWSEDRNIDKSVDLTFYDHFISLRIGGDSEIWVNGKYEQITSFLRTKKPVLWFLKTTQLFMLRGVLFTILFSGLGIMISRFISGGIDSVGIRLPVMLLVVSLLDTVLSKFQYTKIYIEERKSFIEKYNSALLIIGAVGAVFTVIGVIKDFLKE